MRRIAVGITLVAVLALMVLLGTRALASRPNKYIGLVPVSPRPAPDFELKQLGGGEPVRLSAYRGKVVVISFGASWCPSCREEAPRREAVWRQVKDGGDIQFIGIHVWDKEKDAQAFAEEFGITHPMVLDGSGKVAIEFGITGVPETFIIDPTGNIVRRAIGPVAAEQLKSTLDDLTGRSDTTMPARSRPEPGRRR